MSDFSGEDLDSFWNDMSSESNPPSSSPSFSSVQQPMPQQSVPQAPAAQAEIVVAQKQNGIATKTFFDDMDFSFLDNIKGVEVVDSGTVVSRYPIDKIDFSDVKPERFSVLIDKVIVCPYHYFDGCRNVICNGGHCCELGNKRKLRYIYFAVHYTNVDKNGKILSPAVELKALSLAEQYYRKLCDIQKYKGDLSNFDIIGTLTKKGGSAEFSDLNFNEVGPATWKMNQAVAKGIIEDYKERKNKILDFFAEQKTPEEIDRMIEEAKKKRSQEINFAGFGR